MAVKTITIDMEAYDLLAADKREGESFSKVIKRRLRPKYTARDLLENLDRVLLEEETLERLKDVVASRRESITEPPVLDSGD